MVVRQSPEAAARRSLRWWATASRGWGRRRGSATTPSLLTPSGSGGHGPRRWPPLRPSFGNSLSRNPFPARSASRPAPWLGLRQGLRRPESICGPLAEANAHRSAPHNYRSSAPRNSAAAVSEVGRCGGGRLTTQWPSVLTPQASPTPPPLASRLLLIASSAPRPSSSILPRQVQASTPRGGVPLSQV